MHLALLCLPFHPAEDLMQLLEISGNFQAKPCEMLRSLPVPQGSVGYGVSCSTASWAFSMESLFLGHLSQPPWQEVGSFLARMKELVVKNGEMLEDISAGSDLPISLMVPVLAQAPFLPEFSWQLLCELGACGDLIEDFPGGKHRNAYMDPAWLLPILHSHNIKSASGLAVGKELQRFHFHWPVKWENSWVEIRIV